MYSRSRYPLTSFQLIMADPGVVSTWCPTSDGMNDLGDLKEEELSQADRVALDGIVWRKIDMRVLPLCASFFLLAAVVCFRILFRAQRARSTDDL